MKSASFFFFPPFRFDPVNAQLWNGTQEVPLRPQVYSLLHYFLEHPHQLIPKRELLDHIWADSHGSKESLTACIRALRKTLGDPAKAPRFIQTVRGRGYRFIAPLTSTQPPPIQNNPFSPAPPLVGREAELTQLHELLENTLQGTRQLVFVTGEPGIGKTTLIEAFLRQVQQSWSVDTIQIVQGQCFEHYGTSEAYLPLLEALGQLCRGNAGQRCTALLRQHAPTWLIQLPWLVSPQEREQLERKTTGASPARLHREFAQVLEVLCADQPLFLILEDLHWSDEATLKLLVYLAQRSKSDQLLLLGSFRPGYGQDTNKDTTHPLLALTQELRLSDDYTELPLELFSPSIVAKYLEASLSEMDQARLQPLARFVSQQTEGNPLFIQNLLGDLISRGILQQQDGRWALSQQQENLTNLAVGVPANLRQMIEKRLERLSSQEQLLLEAASAAAVESTEFSLAAVTAGLGRQSEHETLHIEELCAHLAQRAQFIQPKGRSEWPDGTVTAQYEFRHALYHEVLSGRIPGGKRAELHRCIGKRLEQAYGEQAPQIARKLAAHFQAGRDYPRAIQYLQHAAGNAGRRSAYQEALNYLRTGMELLQTLPDTPERSPYEIALHLSQANPLTALHGEAAPAVEHAYTRAWELCQQVEGTPLRFWALFGLWGVRANQGRLTEAHQLGEQLLALAPHEPEPTALLWTHYLFGITQTWRGELTVARMHLEQSLECYDAHPPPYYVYHPKVCCLSFLSLVLQLLGYPDQALAKSREAIVLAQELSHSFSLAFVFTQAAVLRILRRERHNLEEVEALTALAKEHHLPQYVAAGMILKGWALVEQGSEADGISQLQQGREAYQARGERLGLTLPLYLLAQTYAQLGSVAEGLKTVDEALGTAQDNEERFFEAELHRTKGELLLQQPALNLDEEAAACFQRAIAIARSQEANLFELRATISLSRIWQQQGKKKEARSLLNGIYAWFSEGFETVDLKEARALLESLS